MSDGCGRFSSSTTMCRIYPVTSASANLYVTLHQLQFLKRGCLLIYPGFNKMTGNDWVDFTKWYEYISHNCIWDSALYLREEDSAQLHLSQYYRSPKQVVNLQRLVYAESAKKFWNIFPGKPTAGGRWLPLKVRFLAVMLMTCLHFVGVYVSSYIEVHLEVYVYDLYIPPF